MITGNVIDLAEEGEDQLKISTSSFAKKAQRPLDCRE